MSVYTDDKALMPRTSITELCVAWQQSDKQVREAFAMLVEAQNRLNLCFDGSRRELSLVRCGERPDFDKPGEALERLKRQVWGCLVDRLELRTILSLKRIAQLDRQIERGADDDGNKLPDITFENVMGILESNLNMAGQYLNEKVLECYEWLRPRGHTLTDYKTNQKSEMVGVGRKIVLRYACEHHYNTRGFSITYSKRDNFRALDQVMHMLDGKEQPRSHNGELCDAVGAQTNGSKNDFETPYFRGRCFRNQNVHLEIVRDDLLGKFNAIAGGMRIQRPS